MKIYSLKELAAMWGKSENTLRLRIKYSGFIKSESGYGYNESDAQKIADIVGFKYIDNRKNG